MAEETQNSPIVEIRLFGTPEIVVDGQVTTRLPAKTQALLFYLACTAQPTLRKEMALMLWPETPNPGNNLSRAIGRLRSEFSTELIVGSKSIDRFAL